MPAPDRHTTFWDIQVDGRPLPDDVEALLEVVVVDDSLHAPDLFELHFRDPDRVALTKGGFEVGKPVKIAVVGGGAPTTLIDAEVTALEISFDESGTLTVVRGLDASHRLVRGRRTETYRDMTYSDIARKVAARAGLAVGAIDPTQTVHKHVSQANVSDWQFLGDLAHEVGYEVAVVDGRFEFRKPTLSREAPAVGDLTYGDPLQLTLGTNLVSLAVSLTSGGQVAAVKVSGWDYLQKQTVVGTAPAQTVHAETDVAPRALAQRFGSPEHVVTDLPYSSLSQAEAAARSFAEQIASGFVELTAVARGHPRYRAGTAVSVGLAGPPFDGRYTLTQTRHCYTPEEGYLTTLGVSGRQDRSLHGLATGGTHPGPAINGVVSGIVTDTRDPEKLGRVKVKLPRLSDTYETDWVRTVHAGAGPQRGMYLIPEVNDEVLVAFDHGDIRCPYVLGGLHNGKDRPAEYEFPLIDGSTGSVDLRAWQSRTGHFLVFGDKAGREGISLTSGDGKHQLSFSKAKDRIRIKAERGLIQIEAGGDVQITAGGNAVVQASRNLELKGLKVKIDGSTGVEINGGPQVKVTGAQIKLN